MLFRSAPEEIKRMLRIRLRRCVDHAEITFQNSGRTIPEHLRPRLFEQFVSWSGSTGIGLSLVRQILQEHRGKIDYSISVDGLSVFRLELPLSMP